MNLVGKTKFSRVIVVLCFTNHYDYPWDKKIVKTLSFPPSFSLLYL